MLLRCHFYFLAFAFCVLPFHSGAQIDFTKDYQPAKVAGNIPVDFLALSYTQVDSAIHAIEDVSNYREREARKRFLTSSQYQIDGMLRSGMVLFGDPMTSFVNKVAEEILKDDPELRSKLRFYVVKSEEVNAFSTNQGVIFVTVGMLAKIETEAQLGFVLSHEIVHYLKKHTIDSYVEYENMMRNARQYYSGVDDLVRAMSSYSKSLEMEADEEGLDIFLESDYNPKAAEDIFDVFEASMMPFADDEWTIDWFSEGEFRLPSKLHLDKIVEVEKSSRIDEEKFSTHPDVEKRRSTMRSLLESKSDYNGEDFIQPESTFRSVQEMARFELVRYYMQNLRFVKVLYSTFLLQKKYPENKYLQAYRVKALYAIARYHDAMQYSEVIPRYSKVQGESQRMYYAMKRIDNEELYALVVREAWKYRQMDPNDEALQNLSDDAAVRLIRDYGLVLDTFFTTSYMEEVNRVVDLDIDSLWEADRIELIREKEEREASNLSQTEVEESLLPDSTEKIDDNDNSGEGTYNAAHDTIGKAEFLRLYYEEQVPRQLFVYQHFLMANDDFAGYFSSMEDSVVISRRAEEEYENLSLNAKRKIAEKQRQEEQRNKSKGYRLGLDTVIMLSPIYMRADLSEGELLYVHAEQRQQDYIATSESVASDMSLSTIMLDAREMNNADADLFNDMVLISDWVEERYSHNEVEMASIGMENAHEIVERHGTRYVVLSAVLSTEQKRKNAQTILLCSCLTGYGFIPTLIWASVRRQRTIIVTLVLDIVTGEEKMVYSRVIKKKDREDLIHGHIYHTIHQITTNPK